MMDYDFEKYKKKLKKMLKPERYIHSLGVAETAEKLARINNIDEKKAYAAGLLHDAGKNFSYKEMLDLCEEYNIELDEVSKTSAGLIHAPLGAEIVRREFDIHDEEILESIRRHTVGGRNMTALEKIIYISDMAEPNRNFENVDKLREIVYKNLDKAVLMGFDMTIMRSVEKGRKIHPMTVYARNDIIE